MMTNDWVHATSVQNWHDIRTMDVPRLRGNRCTDRFFDGALTDEGAPMGTWFNANNYRGGNITITPYPENVNAATVKGLAFPVRDLLGGYDAENPWQLFFVSDRARGYRQLKFAIARQNDPSFEWLAGHLEPVPGNVHREGGVTYAELGVDEEGSYQWFAEDAAGVERVLISVFVVNDDDDEQVRIPYDLCHVYDIRKIAAKQNVSPGVLVR